MTISETERYINLKPTLRELKIEVTHKCPLSCLHCSSESNPSSMVSIDKKTCLAIIEDALSMGVAEIAFSGGEPLLWDGISEAVATANKGATKATLYTSGNINRPDLRLGELKAAGLSKVVFSLYSDTAEKHELITRVSGSYNSTLIAIRKSIEVGLQTELHFVAMSRTYRALSGVVSLGSSLGVTSVSVLRFVPQGRGAVLSGGILNRVENIELKQTIIGLRSKGYRVRTGSPFNFLGLNDQPVCNAGTTRLLVGPDLQIYPCDAFKQIASCELIGAEDPFSLANASLSECWASSPYLSLIRNHLATEFVEPCKSCYIIETCLSGCLAQKVLASGCLSYEPDPACMRRGR